MLTPKSSSSAVGDRSKWIYLTSSALMAFSKAFLVVSFLSAFAYYITFLRIKVVFDAFEFLFLGDVYSSLLFFLSNLFGISVGTVS